MRDALTKILAVMNETPAGRVPIIAVDGGGGAGKSTFAETLKLLRPDITVVNMDDFYQPLRDRVPSDGDAHVNFDWQRLKSEVLEPIRRGESGQFAPYEWQTDSFLPAVTVPARGVVVVEGVMSLRRELREFYDLKIWLDCPPNLRLQRGLQRDGQAAREIWMREWIPSENLYAEKHAPRDCADLILDSTQDLAAFFAKVFEVRRAVRALLVAEGKYVLLMKMANPESGTGFWIAPGGGVEPGEEESLTLARELREELGLENLAGGRAVWKRQHKFAWAGRFYDQRETFFRVETEKFDPVPGHMGDALEKQAFQELRWWTVEELRESGERFTPRALADLLPPVLDGSLRACIEVGI